MVWNPCSSRSLPLWKSMIGRFSDRKWDVLFSVVVRAAVGSSRKSKSWPKFERERSFLSVKQDLHVFGSESRYIKNISVLSQPESPSARCIKVFWMYSQPEFSLAPYSVAQLGSAVFDGTYTNVSVSRVRSNQLYQNANVFSLERSFSSALKVQQLVICIQRRSRSQANGRSDFRISAFAQSLYAVFDETF